MAPAAAPSPEGSISPRGAPGEAKGGLSKTMMAAIVGIIIVIAAVSGAVLYMGGDDGGGGGGGGGGGNGPGGNGPSTNYSPEDAFAVASGETVDGTVEEEGSSCYYKIELEAGEPLSLTLSAGAGTDYDLVAYYGLDGELDDYIDGSFEDDSSETVQVVAWETGWYLIEVYSYEGTGDFELDVEVGAVVDIDDGDNTAADAQLVTEPTVIEGDLNEHYDTDDYYKVELEAGMMLDVELSVPQECDFDLYVTDVDDYLYDYSDDTYGDEEVELDIEEAGFYYISATAFEGIGPYELSIDFQDTTPTDSNNYPEEAESLAMGSTTDSLNEFNDHDDFYEIYLEVGEVLVVDMEGPSDADFDLWIWDDDYNMYVDDSSANIGSSESIQFAAPYSQTYYIQPSAYEGSGSYTLEAEVQGEAGVPVAIIEVSTLKPEVGEEVYFDGSSSVGNGTLIYEWHVSDGAYGEGELVYYTFEEVGTYTVSLYVTDGYAIGMAEVTVEVVAATSVSNKYAVVVGVADYETVKDLEYCDEDAESWIAHLEDEGYTVHSLIDSQATEAAIISEIAWMESQEDSESYCAFVFSGHGGLDDWTRESYICAWDCDSMGGTITNSELEEAFAGFDSEHIFVFFDSCHSGGMDGISGSGRYVSQTCGKEEFGYDEDRYEHGRWTYWFLVVTLLENDIDEMTQAYDAAYPSAKMDDFYSPMHPEEEYSGASFHL